MKQLSSHASSLPFSCCAERLKSSRSHNKSTQRYNNNNSCCSVETTDRCEQVKGDLSKQQREFYLRKQLKAIKDQATIHLLQPLLTVC